MARLTISLSDPRHQALREAAARTGKTLGQIVEESLERYGIKTTEEALDLVRRARGRAGLDAANALELAVTETRAHRNRTPSTPTGR